MPVVPLLTGADAIDEPAGVVVFDRVHVAVADGLLYSDVV